MAFDDAALERALRAETKHGLTLYCNGETLTALGYEWMAVVPMDGLRDRPAGGRRHRRTAVPPRISTARGHGQRGDAPKVAASGGNELVRLGRAGGINGQQKARRETGGRRHIRLGFSSSVRGRL